MKHDYAKIKLECLLRDLNNYTADEFRRQMMRIASGATGEDIPDDAHTIKVERDALAAQVETLKTAYKDLCGAINDLDETDSDSEEMWGQVFSVMSDGWNSLSREPQQHLVEIRAEAGRAGYLQGHLDAMGDPDEIDKEHAEHRARQYANKIRQGGAK